jgi:hypothetical protein
VVKRQRAKGKGQRPRRGSAISDPAAISLLPNPFINAINLINLNDELELHG